MRITRDDIFEALGMQERGFGDWFGPALVGFGVGALLGASIALLVAPRAGAELRDELMSRGRRMVQRGRAEMSEMAEEVGRPEPRNY